MSFRGRPLPQNWEEAIDSKTGKSYFIDHENKVTTWYDPRHWYDPDKPRTFAECKNNELPLGWEEVNDQRYGTVFMNHITRHVQVNDPRVEFLEEKQKMIQNFMSQARSQHVKDNEPKNKPEKMKPNGTLNIEQLEIENQKTKQRLERLRGEVRLSMGINDLRKEREHVKSLIQKTDERIDILMKELRKTEPRTEGLLKVAELERKLTEAAILHVSSNDPVNAREEQERSCEVLKLELQEAKKINNENLKNEVRKAERREEIIKQVQQQNQSRQRLALILDSLNQRRPRPQRSHTFSDPRQKIKNNDDKNEKVISMINLTDDPTERDALMPPYNQLPRQVQSKKIEESVISVNSPCSSGYIEPY